MSFDLRETITQKFIDALENSKTPWDRPWVGGGLGARNLVSKKPYRGINTLLTAMTGFDSPWWATFKQWSDHQLSVRKGEKGTQIVFWKVSDRESDDVEGRNRKSFVLRYYYVFNAEQVAPHPSLDKDVAAESQAFLDTLLTRPASPDFKDFQPAENVIRDTKAEIFLKGSRAYYDIQSDTITVPPKKMFKTEGGFYGTILHELVHWTGHQARLNREFGSRFADNAYAFEELVAEIASCFVCNELNVPNSEQLENHVGYVSHWLDILKRDKSAIIKAAKLASDASDYIQGRHAATEEIEPELITTAA